jgi:hypothetical protein
MLIVDNISTNRFFFIKCFFIFFVLPYLFYNTGLQGDDFGVINELKNKNNEIFNFSPKNLNKYIYNIPAYYTFWVFYGILGDSNLYAYDLLKYVSISLSIYFLYLFLSDYLSKSHSIILSIIFIFNPIHDSSIYWYMAIPLYIFFPTLLFISHKLIRNEKYFFGIICLLIGSFNYSSLPFIIGLASIFFLEKEYKKGLIFVFSGTLYLFFYYCITYLYPGLEQRINEDLSLIIFSKSFFLQLITSIDALFGLSAFYKIFYGIFEITYVGIMLSIIITFIFSFHIDKVNINLKFKKLFICFLIIYLVTMVIYASTGLYAQSSFNLGNRVVTNGCLLVALLFILSSKYKFLYLLLTFVLMLSIFGTSSHWKNSNVTHNNIIKNINTDQNLLNLQNDSLVVLDNNSYSKLGKFSHIDFLSIPWVLNNIYSGKNGIKFVNLSKYLIIDDQDIVDTKFDLKYKYTKIYYYNTNNSNFFKITSLNLNELVTNKNKEIRHWVQLPFFSFTHSFIIKLSPRLIYLFN